MTTPAVASATTNAVNNLHLRPPLEKQSATQTPIMDLSGPEGEAPHFNEAQLRLLLRAYRSPDNTNGHQQGPYKRAKATDLSQIADALSGNVETKSIPTCDHGASTIDRATFIRKCGKLNDEDNHTRCWRALKLRSKLSTDSLPQPVSHASVTRHDWVLIARAFVLRCLHTATDDAVDDARRKLRHLYKASNSLQAFFSEASELWATINYTYTLAEDKPACATYRAFVKSFIDGLPEHIKVKVNYEANRKRAKSRTFSLEQAYNEAVAADETEQAPRGAPPRPNQYGSNAHGTGPSQDDTSTREHNANRYDTNAHGSTSVHRNRNPSRNHDSAPAMCWDFRSGTCSRGGRCRFSHGSTQASSPNQGIRQDDNRYRWNKGSQNRDDNEDQNRGSSEGQNRDNNGSRNQGSSGGQNRSSNSGSRYEIPTCYRCLKVGHMRRECRGRCCKCGAQYPTACKTGCSTFRLREGSGTRP